MKGNQDMNTKTGVVLCLHLRSKRYTGHAIALAHDLTRLWCNACFARQAILEDTNPDSTCDQCNTHIGMSQDCKTFVKRHRSGVLIVGVLCADCAAALTDVPILEHWEDAPEGYFK